MRRQYLFWSISVFGVVATAYGGYLLVYHFNHGKGLNVPSLLLLIFGIAALMLSLVFLVSYYFVQKKKKDEPIDSPKEEAAEEKVVKTVVEEEKTTPSIKPEPRQEDVEYVSRPQTPRESYTVSTIYVKQVGYGPLLRINGNRILDMRNNTYYRIEGNMVMQDGYGPAFEIRDNQIKGAFGGYLYELSGSNINKVFGGFYASVNGNYITIYDLSVKYEMTDSLSKRQILVVVALLFGKY